MKLGTKIIAGFGGLIFIALILGGTAVWKMSGVKSIATTLANDYMPAASVANNVERGSLETMYEMRGYAFTEDTNMLAKAVANLAEVKNHLQEAKDLAVKAGGSNLAFLKQAAERAEARALEYEELAKQTVTVTQGLEQDRLAMNVAAQDYMKQCNDYEAAQAAKLQEVLGTTNAATGVDVAAVHDRVNKMKLANDILDLGDAIRIGNFKSQASRDPQLFRETQKKFDGLNPMLDELRAVTKLEVNLKQIELCRAAGKAYSEAMASFLDHWLVREELGKKRGLAAAAVLAEAKNTAISSMDSSAKSSATASTSLTTASSTMIIGLVIAALFGITLAILITRGITKVLTSISASLSEGAEQTVSAAAQVSSSSQSLAEGASEQASSLEETSASLEEMASMTKRNAENARQANDLAKQAREAADKGVGDMQTMASAMEAIKVSSDDIAKIIKTIDEIAFQTNILALNAAVEAARAGEAGMGFAVVADEVRNLAQRCAQAAKETSGKIEGAIVKTGQGVAISSQVAATLNDIVSKARQVDELVTEVANASREQTEGITQVNVAVSQMDKVTQSNAANAEESAAAAEELNAQAETMKQSVTELLQLVGGKNVAATSRPGAAARRLQPAYTAAPKTKRLAPDHANGNGSSHGGSNGNGHAHPVPALKTDQRRSEIPMADDFKNF